LIDLYYLKERQLRKGRIVFERTKTNTGTRDLKLHPKAIAVIDRNKVNGSEWLFRKDKNSMKCLGVLTSAPDFYENYNEVQPDGHIAVKVARHSFANRAKI
jgi:hypothetical protein